MAELTGDLRRSNNRSNYLPKSLKTNELAPLLSWSHRSHQRSL